jgi:ubiquinone/menaquinone biosynthesis C-methylase UbiE
MIKKEHLQWWDNNLNNKKNDFIGWLDTSDIKSREFIFKFISENKITNVLECGPGTFIDYNLFFKTNELVGYSCIDITDDIVKEGKENNIDISLSSIENIEKLDNSFELVYCRHVLEHQDSYKKSLEEMIRVSSKYAIVIFWLLTDNENNEINYDENQKLYHNTYSKKEIENYLSEFNVSYSWEYCDIDKILVIEKN